MASGDVVSYNAKLKWKDCDQFGSFHSSFCRLWDVNLLVFSTAQPYRLIYPNHRHKLCDSYHNQCNI